MKISEGNTFSIPCQSMQGVRVETDFGDGPAWLANSGSLKSTSVSNSIDFTLVKDKMGGAKPATVTIKNNVGGKDLTFTVTPTFLAPVVTYANGNVPTQNTMSGTDIKLYQVNDSRIQIKVSALGGSYVKNASDNITVTADDNYDMEKTYTVTWKSGTSATFVLANKSDNAKETVTYNVNAPAATISADNQSVTGANSGTTNIRVNAPEEVIASISNLGGGDQWFTLGTSTLSGPGNITIV